MEGQNFITIAIATRVTMECFIQFENNDYHSNNCEIIVKSM